MAKGTKTGGGSRKGKPNKASQEIREAARAYTSEAIETLVDVMRHSKSDQARVMAADKVLDRGWGKATQPISGDEENPLHVVMHGMRQALGAKLDRLTARQAVGG